MEIWRWVFIGILFIADSMVKIEPFKLGRSQPTERISGSAGDVLEDDPVGRLEEDIAAGPEMPQPHTFGQRNHVCLKEGSITIPPYAPPQKMQTHLIPEKTPRSIFVYFRGLFYDVGNDPEGGYYARGARAAAWENFKDNPLFDISNEHPTTYYEGMQRAVFCLCPLGWAPWSPRLVEAVIFGCIPVIIADDIVLPFVDAIPWEEIGVFVNEKDVPNLDTILASIAPEVILRKQRLLSIPSMKQAMLFPQPAQPGDAFHLVLNRLARKLPHDRSVYLKPGERVLNWTAGPVGDLKPW
ncbi:putative beta-1,4-xylosyltransferase IRX10L [Hibiscus syriacus]|uniref:Beta-1,4-xylosyltransferase IRX10L n=1 Tax=Hibiscus syriacus TaxID=106335 RepID=A0A6A3AFZ5_HIBSY|nr:putative beta-1,4-xylosyltransferase IRX10L [Hibiscus syriacus]